jgi:hypothetical protein
MQGSFAMPEFDSSTLALLTLGSGLGLILAGIALRANLLEGRAATGRCAACGRLLERNRECRCLR